MYIMLNVENIALKKSKSLCFASKEKVLKNDGIKSNDGNMIKTMMKLSLLMEVRIKVCVFWMIL